MKKHSWIINYLYITLGVALIALSYYFLFLPKNLVTGGVTGIAIICNGVFGEGFSPTILIYILNTILLLVGLIFLGRDFFVKTVYGSLLLPTITAIFEFCKVPNDILFTLDEKIFHIEGAFQSPLSQLIVAVIIGSLATGAGLGLCFRNNATTGGMDVVQKLMAKFLHFPYSKSVYVTDGIVVICSFFVFGLEKTIYALICIFLIGLIVDYISMGGRARRTAFIISGQSDEIKKIIIEKLVRGVTVVPASGGYSRNKYDMLICTLSKNESYLLRDLVYEIDPNAFTFYVSAKEVYGDGFE